MYDRNQIAIVEKRHQIAVALSAVADHFAESVVAPLGGAIEVDGDNFHAIIGTQPVAGFYTGKTDNGLVVSVPCAC